MAKIRGTTTRAGKTRTQSVSKVVADNIERPHSGRPVKKVGDQSELEAQALSGQSGARAGSVRQIGPTDIRRPNGPTGSVKYVGTKNFEDVFATRGLGIPYSRQSGSVRQVGPASRDFARANEGSGGVGTFKSGRLPRSSGLISKTTLLKSGVDRVHPRAVFAGQPGSFATRAARRIGGGSAGGSTLINGRRRGAGIPLVVDEGDTQVIPGGPSIVPGNIVEGGGPASVVSQSSSAVTDTTATIAASVRANGQPTTYYFEYGEDDTYGTSIPVGEDGDAGEAQGAVTVDENLTGLTAETEYHFRVVLENDDGIVEGADQTFTTTA